MGVPPRFGVVVPPANPVVEPEFVRLLDAGAVFHTTRFPVFLGMDQRQRNEGYLRAEPDSVAAFGALRLTGIFIACTGSHYPLDLGDEESANAELSERAGCPVLPATMAIAEVLRAAKATELVIVSPYEPWLTELSGQYWTRQGFKVSTIVQVRAESGFSPYDVTPAGIIERFKTAGIARDATVLFTGTGMATIEAMTALGEGNQRITVSSNLCGAWWMRSRLDAPRPLEDSHPLVARLGRQLAQAQEQPGASR